MVDLNKGFRRLQSADILADQICLNAIWVKIDVFTTGGRNMAGYLH